MRTRHGGGGDGRDKTRAALISGSSTDLSAANSDDANNFRCTEFRARAIYRCKSKSLRRYCHGRKSDLEKNKEVLEATAFRVSPPSIAISFSVAQIYNFV